MIYSEIDDQMLQALLYNLFSAVFSKINSNYLVLYCYKKASMILSNADKHEEIKNKLALGNWYFENRKYKKAKSCLIKAIRFYKNFSDMRVFTN